MPIQLPPETRQPLIASIKRYFRDHLEHEIGDLQAGLLLEFCLAEIGPSVYNQAVADVQTYLQRTVADLDSTCFEPEPGYWRK